MVAIAVPDIGPLISLVGSVGFSMLGLIIPVFMETVWNWYPMDDDDEHEQDDWDSVLPSTNGVAAVTATVVPNGVTVNNAVDEKKKNEKKISGRRVIGRSLRHIKNIVLFLLAMFALIGGAYYNILDIVARANGTLPPMI